MPETVVLTAERRSQAQLPKFDLTLPQTQQELVGEKQENKIFSNAPMFSDTASLARQTPTKSASKVRSDITARLASKSYQAKVTNQVATSKFSRKLRSDRTSLQLPKNTAVMIKILN